MNFYRSCIPRWSEKLLVPWTSEGRTANQTHERNPGQLQEYQQNTRQRLLPIIETTTTQQPECTNDWRKIQECPLRPYCWGESWRVNHISQKDIRTSCIWFQNFLTSPNQNFHLRKGVSGCKFCLHGVQPYPVEIDWTSHCRDRQHITNQWQHSSRQR